jgi:VWFA-related protein
VQQHLRQTSIERNIVSRIFRLHIVHPAAYHASLNQHRAILEIEIAPLQAQNLAHAKAQALCDQHHRPVWFAQMLEQLKKLAHAKDPWPLEPLASIFHAHQRNGFLPSSTMPHRSAHLTRRSAVDSCHSDSRSASRRAYPLSLVSSGAFKVPASIQDASSLMRRWCLIVFLVATAIPLSASKHMTVAQLQQALNTAINAHKPDTEIAREIGGFELTERLTEGTLGTLQARLVPSTQGARALEVLADRSAFFDPPPNELPTTPAPDSAEQTRMLQAARRYVSQTLPRLPDIFATRVISLYDDRPQALKKDEWPTRSGLHVIDTSSGEISVRNERENQPATQGSAVWQANVGLISGGEFGNTLGMILADTANGDIRWNHWEESAKGRVAVFSYEVPASASHYEVLNAVPSNPGIVHTKPGYHGSIGVSPADGTILRITMDADVTRGAPFRRAAILVEYGPIDIGGTTFTCPVRSIALSMAVDDPDTFNGDAPKEWLNETHFIHYHRFASQTRILTGGSAPPSAKAEPARTDVIKESVPHVVTSEAPEMQADERSPVKAQPLPPAAESTPVPAAKMQAPQAGGSQPGSGRSGEQPPPASTTPAEPVTEQATSTVAANEPPAFAVAPPGSIPTGGVTLHVEVPELLIPAVARDKQGRAVGKLGQSDFTVFDQGKVRAITGFTVVNSAAAGVVPTGPETGATAGSGVVVTGASPTPAPSQNRFILFLFDDRHLNSSDLAITQTAAVKMLDEPLAATDYEAVLSFSGVNSGITRDRAVLQAAIKKLKVHRTFQHDTRDCPDIDYYAADRILNQHDSTEFAVAVAKAKACGAVGGLPSPEDSGEIDGANTSYFAERLARSVATRALAVGEEDARQSLLLIGAVVSAMSKLPGQRTLILVSPGFLSLSPEAMTFKSELLDRAAGSNVVISALDARGLYVGNADASQGGNSTISDMFGSTSQDRLAAMQASENAMAELAYGTGGTFFHNNNDLENGLKSLAAAPQYLYLLQVSLKDVKPTGTYHRLQVKVDQHDLDVQARRGYFAPTATNRKQSGATASDRKN